MERKRKKIRQNLKSPLNLHDWKKTEFYKKVILLEKGCDFSKSFEPNKVLSYKTYIEILKSKLNSKVYVHLLFIHTRDICDLNLEVNTKEDNEILPKTQEA